MLRKLYAVVFSLMFLSFAAIVYLGYEWWTIKTTVVNGAADEARKATKTAGEEIDAQLQFAMQAAQQLADELTNDKISYENIEKTLVDQLTVVRARKDKNSFHLISVAFGKGLYDKNQPEQMANWYAIYDKEKMTVVSKTRDYDYTQTTNKRSDWFVKAIETNQPYWEEPRFSTTNKELIAGYSVPFYATPDKKEIRGVVYVNYALKEVKRLMLTRDFNGTGYGIIFSKQNRLLYHPNELIVKGANNRSENKSDQVTIKDTVIKNDLEVINKVKKFQTDVQYTLPTGQESWVFNADIPSTQWRLKVVFLLNELGLEARTLENQLHFIGAVMFFLFCILFYFFLKNYNDIHKLWIISTAITLVFVIALVRLWSLSDGLPPASPPNNVKLKTKADITTFEEQHNKISKMLQLDKPAYIPTGVFLKSSEFSGANNVTVSGYVWQKYYFDTNISEFKDRESLCNYQNGKEEYIDTLPKTKGVVFFEAVESAIEFNCAQASYVTQNSEGYVTIGWYIKLTLRQPFDYSKYPFDKNVIWLRMLHSEFAKNVVLTPDNDGYSLLYDSAKSGVDTQSFVLPGWNLTGTYFSVMNSFYNSNLGMESFTGQFSPELYFNIEITRMFLDPFISGITPVVMIVLVLFIVLFASSNDEKVAGKFGFNAIAVFAILPGLLFSVALWHSGLRTTLASTQISYFECFYITCYFLIALVGLDSLILSSHYKVKLLRYEDNLVVKLAFLPLMAAMLFLATLAMLF